MYQKLNKSILLLLKIHIQVLLTHLFNFEEGLIAKSTNECLLSIVSKVKDHPTIVWQDFCLALATFSTLVA